MLIYAATIVRLKCSFHFLYTFYCLKSMFRAAKLHKSFELRKKYAKFSLSFYVFFKKMRTFAPEKEKKTY